jgi:hypothetical protein
MSLLPDTTQAMQRPQATRSRASRRTRRFAAWIVTGPVGHLYGGVADLTALLARYALARARGRDPWSGG